MRRTSSLLAAIVIALAGLASPAQADSCSAHASRSYYESSDHATVHGPDCDSQGVTAHCEDGTLSHSHHHKGTCSHHGGVDHWDHPPSG